MRKIEPTEHQIQCAIVEWANHKIIPPYTDGKIGHLLIAIPNGGYRNKIEAARLKKEGVKAGVSDLFFAFPAFKFHGLWIEIKTKKGKLSKEQKNWIELMSFMNYKAVVVYSVDEGIQAIKDYLGLK